MDIGQYFVDEDGEGAVTCLITDITKRMEREQTIRIAHEEIARQALERPGGARNIRHLLQTLVQTPLSDVLLSGTPPKALQILAREGKIVVSVTDGDRAETGE